jgi:hypothetical protein
MIFGWPTSGRWAICETANPFKRKIVNNNIIAVGIKSIAIIFLKLSNIPSWYCCFHWRQARHARQIAIKKEIIATNREMRSLIALVFHCTFVLFKQNKNFKIK